MAGCFSCPDSCFCRYAKLLFTISFKYFGRIDGTKADLPLIPHYEVEAADAIDKLYEISNVYLRNFGENSLQPIP